MTISLPPVFDQRLHGHALETGIVHSAINVFCSWFQTSRTVFFPDFTDHGTEHVANVLATADAMITKEASGVISAADVTILTLATLLHDSALHLTEPGFEKIVKGQTRDRIDGLDLTSWPSLWEDFLFSARRWNDERLKNVFGDQFVAKGYSISDPFDRWGNLTTVDFKLIGEFIRWHHPRLAHEFAVYGVPGAGENLTLPEGIPTDWADIAGVVARSHGLPLRACLDWVSKRYHNKREYQNIHTVYLMALIRVADYLQIQAERAPETVFQFRVLPSRTSKLEWRAHHSIKNITPEHEDPESVEITANPPDIETYLRVRQWLDGIQTELDKSWAVLGEVYGRYERLKALGFRWRRVRSNLDNTKRYAETVTYVPRRVRLEVARPELLTLLIRPLYGDDPSYGVRELMQNAVDAVRERKSFQERRPESTHAHLREQDAEVVVWLSDFDEDQDCAWMEICDRGIGMTEHVITDYFLTAGSSYRHSDEWQKLFERNDRHINVSQPRSRIARTGRFGIGGLAAFLLGDEIEVETRHIGSEQGFCFRFSIVDEAVSLERVSNLAVGTRIRVKIGRGIFEKLTRNQFDDSKPSEWDWYILDSPTVLRLRGDNRAALTQRLKIDLATWRNAATELPMTVSWAYPGFVENHRALPMLSCNGFYISNSAPKISPERCGENAAQPYWISTPHLHVTDPDGNFGLGLTRTNVISSYGFERDLCASIVQDYLARLLITFPEEVIESQIMSLVRDAPFKKSRGPDSPDFLLCRDGFCMPFDDAVKSAPHPIQTILWLRNLTKGWGDENINPWHGIRNLSLWDCVTLENGLVLSTFSNLKGTCCPDDAFLSKVRSKGMDIKHFRITDGQARDLKKIKASRSPISAIEDVWLDRIPPCRLLVETRGMPPAKYPFTSLVGKSKGGHLSMPFVAELILAAPWTESFGEGLISEWWKRYFGSNWIPWKLKERKKKFPRAFKELAPYIDFYA